MIPREWVTWFFGSPRPVSSSDEASGEASECDEDSNAADRDGAMLHVPPAPVRWTAWLLCLGAIVGMLAACARTQPPQQLAYEYQRCCRGARSTRPFEGRLPQGSAVIRRMVAGARISVRDQMAAIGNATSPSQRCQSIGQRVAVLDGREHGGAVDPIAWLWGFSTLVLERADRFRASGHCRVPRATSGLARRDSSRRISHSLLVPRFRTVGGGESEEERSEEERSEEERSEEERSAERVRALEILQRLCDAQKNSHWTMSSESWF